MTFYCQLFTDMAFKINQKQTEPFKREKSVKTGKRKNTAKTKQTELFSLRACIGPLRRRERALSYDQGEVDQHLQNTKVYKDKICRICRIQKLTMTMKVEDMAAEFLLTFLAVLVQLGLPARQNQVSGKEPEPGYAFYRSEYTFTLKYSLRSSF